MKLNIFNRWASLGTIAQRKLEYQTAKMNDNINFVTFIRDAETQKIITKAFGNDKNVSLERATNLLKRIGPDGIYQAIETGEPVLREPVKQQAPEKEIEWRDGIGHSARAQKRIVGEGKEEKEDKDKPKINNLVAKHARKFNKAVVMRDRKNDYKRKDKHDKDETAE